MVILLFLSVREAEQQKASRQQGICAYSNISFKIPEQSVVLIHDTSSGSKIFTLHLSVCVVYYMENLTYLFLES